jgi:hypothetical protein
VSYSIQCSLTGKPQAKHSSPLTDDVASSTADDANSDPGAIDEWEDVEHEVPPASDGRRSPSVLSVASLADDVARETGTN